MDNIKKVNRNKSRAPRPIKGEITVVVLESYNEHGKYWELSDILFDTTPLQAIERYYDEILDLSITKDEIADQGGTLYAELARAYYLSI